MQYCIGLGSNLGDRKANLQKALQLIQSKLQLNKSDIRQSFLYESPALLQADALDAWNLPYLNMAISFPLHHQATELHDILKSIEHEIGRRNTKRWSPREIDLDILLCGDEIFNTENLQIPHKEIYKRAFVLDPLKDLLPNFKIPSYTGTILQHARKHTNHAPVWMAILNATPDSFSDGGRYDSPELFTKELELLDRFNVGILDLGAESTRPGAVKIDPEAEWARLNPKLELIREYWQTKTLKPKISVDTRNPFVARKAIEWGIDILNDVSGLENPEMRALIRNNDIDCVFMHSLTVPADKSVLIEEAVEPVKHLQDWLSAKLEHFSAERMNLDRLIFDPGIGFNKNTSQSLKLLQNVQSFHSFPLQVLIGHSRKSFMNNFSEQKFSARDWESVGASLKLIEQGVDILRVHNIEAHIRAYRAWSHLQK